MADLMQLTRNQLYGRLRQLQKRAGLSDDAYRERLREHGAQRHEGRWSATTMSHVQLVGAAMELQALADTARAGRPARVGWLDRVPKARRPQWRMVLAIWRTLYERGAVRDRSVKAMLSFARRHCRSDALEWADGADLNKTIEALKEWEARTPPLPAGSAR